MPFGRLALVLPFIVFLADPSSRSAVRVERGRVIVHAAGAPLAEVLSRFSQATGTKVVYSVARPRQLVSLDIDAASEAEALAQLLEGQELGYGLRLDKTGKHVEILLVTGKGGGVTPPAPASADAEPPEPPPVEIEEAQPAEQQQEEAPAAPAQEPAPGAPSLGGAPSFGGAPGGPAPVNPVIGGMGSPSGPGPFAPGVPSPASYPRPVSYPGPPTP